MGGVFEGFEDNVGAEFFEFFRAFFGVDGDGGFAFVVGVFKALDDDFAGVFVQDAGAALGEGGDHPFGFLEREFVEEFGVLRVAEDDVEALAFAAFDLFGVEVDDEDFFARGFEAFGHGAAVATEAEHDDFDIFLEFAGFGFFLADGGFALEDVEGGFGDAVEMLGQCEEVGGG